MNKSELIEEVARRADLSKMNAAIVVNTIFDSMISAMKRGDRIEIRNFGNFTMREYKPYKGRNPKTGEPVEVPAKRMPYFKVGKGLKELLNS